MAEERIVKFCALVGPSSISLVMANCPPGGHGQGHAKFQFFWQISVDISKMVQNKDILTMED